MSPPLTPDQTARIERHTRIVRTIARRVIRSAGTDLLNADELTSVGNEALVQAAMRYDPSGTASFATFAQYRVYGAMIDAIRKRTPGRRNQKRALIRLEATQALLGQSAEDQAAQRAAGHTSSLEERVDMARELVRKAAIAVRLSEPTSVRVDGLAADGPDPEELLVSADERDRVWSLVEELEPGERALLEAIYVEGRTMKELAAELKTTGSTISRRHTRIIERLTKRVRAKELGSIARSPW